jgi:hypothetical protein
MKGPPVSRRPSIPFGCAGPTPAFAGSDQQGVHSRFVLKNQVVTKQLGKLHFSPLAKRTSPIGLPGKAASSLAGLLTQLPGANCWIPSDRRGEVTVILFGGALDAIAARLDSVRRLPRKRAGR